MTDVFAYCTVESCEYAPKCRKCGRTKKPIGRDSLDNGKCDRDCPGYSEDPTPGHLWPGEIARSRSIEE